MTQARYKEAADRYADLGVDVEAALQKLEKIKVSIHCWQGDDVRGFFNDSFSGGGVLATGGYKGVARTPSQLREDIGVALSCIPGKHKLNLHAMYLDTEKKVDFDTIAPEHYRSWVDWAKENGVGLDFNPTCFSHPKFQDNFSISHINPAIRDFWIEHCKRSRHIAAYFGKELHQVSAINYWFPDGFKDTPADRLAPRKRMKEALDKVFVEKLDPKYIFDSFESKLFGIGVESYTVASHEFVMAYAQSRKIGVTIDSGHFHLTESIADKLSCFKAFDIPLLLHVSRPVRWDSDHVVTLDDALISQAQELVRCGLLETTHIALDYFDASINRVAAWVIGTRNLLKSLLFALLEPTDTLRSFEDRFDFTSRLAYQEDLKLLPFGAIWDYYCEKMGTPPSFSWLDLVQNYEKDVLSKRA